MLVCKKLLLVLSLSLVTLSSFADSNNRLILTGSSTVAPLVAEMGKRFEKLHPGIRIDVQTGGSSRGIADVRSGTADLGMISRPLKTSESKLLPFLIANDGIALILNRTNPVKTLSHQQVIDLVTGTYNSWESVGGLKQRISVINKAAGHSTLELFLNHYGLKNSQIHASVIIGDNQQGIKLVASNQNAIGYVSIGAAAFAVEQGVAIKLLPANGIEATVEQVQQGKFPLIRPLNLVAKTAPEGLAKQFIEFAQSSAVSDLIADHYFVPPTAQ